MGLYDYIYDPSLITRAIFDATSTTLVPWVTALILALVGIVALLVVFVTPFLLLTMWTERKFIGRIQVRYGPNRVGPMGMLQPIADAIKLLTKEAFMPAQADKIVYLAAPIVGFIPALLAFAVLPLGPNIIFTDLNIGILYVIAVGSVSALNAFMAGWSSNNKYSLLGAMRAVAQMVSYEVPMVLSVLGVVLLAGSLQMGKIVQAQVDGNVWYVLLQPLGFFIYFTAALAELNRSPMDILEAESEIVAGYHTEYSGFKFALFFVAEYANAIAVSAICATLFFGGWASAPLLDRLPPYLWFGAKIYFFFCIMLWLRGTLPRLRVDQLMGFAWKFLLPMAMINLFLVAAEILIWQTSASPPQLALPIIGVVNYLLAGLLVVFWARTFGPKGVVA